MKFLGTLMLINVRIIDTLLKNELNDIEVRIENEKSSLKDSSNIEKTLELLSEYSSELRFKRNIEKFEKTLAKKKDELRFTNSGNSSIAHTNNINNDFISNSNKSEKILKIYPEVLSKDFNIIDFKKNIGEEDTFSIVCATIFEQNNLFSKIYKSTFINFIDEMKCSYINKNNYHNVNFN